MALGTPGGGGGTASFGMAGHAGSRGLRAPAGGPLAGEVGLRHDGGDAVTGAGMDVGVGVIMSDASTGLAVDIRVRTLLVYQAEGFSERGVSLSLSYNPTPSTPLGFVAPVAPSWGGQATSGAGRRAVEQPDGLRRRHGENKRSAESGRGRRTAWREPCNR